MKLFAALSALLVLKASGSSETRNLIFTNDTVVGDSNSTVLVPTLFTFGESDNFTVFTNPEIAALFLNESAFLNFTFFDDGGIAFTTTGAFANESGIDPIIFQSGVGPALNSSTPEVIMTVTSANNLTAIPLPVEVVTEPATTSLPEVLLIEPVSAEVPMTVETVTEEVPEIVTVILPIEAPITEEAVTEEVPEIVTVILPIEAPITEEAVTEEVPEFVTVILPIEAPITEEAVTEAVPITKEAVTEEVPEIVTVILPIEAPITKEAVTEAVPITKEAVTEEVPEIVTVILPIEAPITEEAVTEEVPEIVTVVLPIEAPITKEAVTEEVPKPDTVEPPITILIPPVLTTTNLPGSAPAGAPAWFDLIKATYLPPPEIKVCAKKKNVAPVNGTKCSKKMEKTCFFGDTLCNGKPFPTTRCACTGPSDSRTWKCTPVSCP